MITLLAATEPVTPKLFVLVVVLLLVKVTIDLAGRTSSVRSPRSRRNRTRSRAPARSPAARPPWFAAFAKGHSRWTPANFWVRMLADLTPLRPSERDELITERTLGIRELVQFINFDDDKKNNPA